MVGQVRTIRLQFHAEPHELIGQLLPQWLSGLNVYVAIDPTGFGHAPRYVISQAGLPRFADVDSEVPFWVFLRHQPFVLPDDPRTSAFLLANPDTFAVLPGRQYDEGLTEAAMSGGSDNPDIFKAWQLIVRRARQRMTRGSVLINAAGRHHNASHRFSPGALHAHAAGTRLITHRGGNQYEPLTPAQPTARLRARATPANSKTASSPAT